MSDVYDREVDEPTEDEERIMQEERKRELLTDYFAAGARTGSGPIVVTKPHASVDWFGIGFALLVVWNVAATVALLILWATR